MKGIWLAGACSMLFLAPAKEPHNNNNNKRPLTPKSMPPAGNPIYSSKSVINLFSSIPHTCLLAIIYCRQNLHESLIRVHNPSIVGVAQGSKYGFT